jgi:hypothetical protein
VALDVGAPVVAGAKSTERREGVVREVLQGESDFGSQESDGRLRGCTAL